MPGWNLVNGECKKENIKDDEIWAIINNIFSNKSYRTTTYKYCFFKCILDNLFNVDESLSLDFITIFTRFAEIYWNLVAKHHLRQIQDNSRWTKSSIEIIIENIISQYKLDNNIIFEALKANIQIELIKKVSAECSKNVIGAFYFDSKECFYGFSKKRKTIWFNSNVYALLVKYKNVIEKLNYYEWIKFLEKVNPSDTVYAIAEKLDYSSKRNNLSAYKEYLLLNFNQNSCFYCGTPLRNSSVEVDHFIPWSFSKDDKLWNFVLSCRTCNNSKRDRLASENYTHAIINRNLLMVNDQINKIVRFDFKGYTGQKIVKMYESAVFNGFGFGWYPKNEKMNL